MKTNIVADGYDYRFIGLDFIFKNIKKFKIFNKDNLSCLSNTNYLEKIFNYKFYEVDINISKKFYSLIKKYNLNYNNIVNFLLQFKND